MTDLLLRLVGEDAASSSFHNVTNALHNAGRAALDFARDSVKAFEESAQADRRLARAAGELTEAFKAQASQLQESLGVSDDMVKAMQAMLLQFGEAPSQVEATTRALLDFSAATGEDALSATRQLLGGVESGRGVFKEYGVQLDLTGKASADLASATEVLAGKFGGGAEGEASSLSGQVRKVKAAFGELQETWGGVISEFLKSSGVLDRVTSALLALGQAAPTKTADSDAFRRARLDDVQASIDALQQGQPVTIDGRVASLDELLAERQRLRTQGRAVQGPEHRPGGLTRPDRTTRAASSLGGGSSSAGRQVLGDDADAAVREHNAAQAWAAEHEWANWGDVTSAQAASEKAKKAMERSAAETVSMVRQAGEARREELVRQVDESGQMGDQIGAALVNAFGAQLQRLAKGGEMDAGELLSSILGSAVSVLGGVLSMLFPGAGALIGAVTGVVGGLGQAGVSAAFAKRHTGGWAGAPRFHGGGWPGVGEVPAVLQSGERVLSRSEVATMGGGAAVDAAARGGGQGLTVAMNVSTFDGRSMREFFEDRGGRGLAQAIRSGRSGLTPALAR